VGIVGHVVERVVDGHKYEVKTFWIGTGWKVTTWDERKRRIGPVYSVALETAQDADTWNMRPALEALVEIAIADLDSGRVKSVAEQP